MLMRRMLYHDEFSVFMQEGCRSSNDACTPRRVCCIIDRKVAKRLRTHLSKLLEPTTNGYLDAKNNMKRPFQTELIYKKHIYHVKEVALHTSLSVEHGTICILDEKYGNYDPRKHELAILEEDMFNIAVCISLGRKLVRNGMRQYRNLSLELKPKCGLLSFSGLPSVFQMTQPYKARIKYQNIISTVEQRSLMARTENDTSDIEVSRYSPLKFFRMRLEDIKKELMHLSQTPQNNIRIFVDNIEVDPILLSRDTYAMEAVASCLVENRKIVDRILKFQGLASGQQFISHMVYCLTKMMEHFGVKVKPEGETMTYKRSGISIAKKLLKTSKELLSLMFSEEPNEAYEIQRLFNLIGRRLICCLCNIMATLIERSGVTFYVDRTNLSFKRLGFPHFNGKRRYVRNYRNASILARELAIHSQGRLLNSNFVDEKAVKILMFDKLEQMLNTIYRSSYPMCYYKQKDVNAQLGNSCNRTSKIAITSKNVSSNACSKVCTVTGTKLIEFLDSCYRWLELYLGGRTAMDLSIVLNVLFHDHENRNEKRLNFFRFSLIDLDMKPIERIPRWKEDILQLIREHRFAVS